MSFISANISAIASHVLHWSPTAWLHSWLLYLGIQTHVRTTINPELRPLHNVCEYLNALHIYTDDARQGRCRSVEAHHFCSHVSKGKQIGPTMWETLAARLLMQIYANASSMTHAVRQPV